MAVAFFRVVLYLGLLLLVMSVFALIIVPRDAPGFVAAVLAVGFNLLTVSVATGLLRWWLAREARQERQQAAARRVLPARGELPPAGEDEGLPRRP